MILTLERWNAIKHFTGIYLRVLVDGEDVTTRCMSADAGAGWAFVYRERDSDGRWFIDPKTRKPAVEILTGEVLFVRRAEV